MILSFIKWLERRKVRAEFKKVGCTLPSSVQIHEGVSVQVEGGAKVKVGPGVIFGPGVSIRVYKGGRLDIGPRSVLGSRVTIACGKAITLMTASKIGDGAIITDVDPIFGGKDAEYSNQAVTVQEGGYISPNAFYGKKPGKSIPRADRPEREGSREERKGRSAGRDRDRDRDRGGRDGNRRPPRGRDRDRNRDNNRDRHRPSKAQGVEESSSETPNTSSDHSPKEKFSSAAAQGGIGPVSVNSGEQN